MNCDRVVKPEVDGPVKRWQSTPIETADGVHTMNSANGYALKVTTHTGTFDLRASWPAPFFAVDTACCWDEGDAPTLYHAETLADARRFGGKVFDANFQPVDA